MAEVRFVLLSVVLCLGCARPGPLPLNPASLRASQPRTILASLPPIPPFGTSGPKRARGLLSFAVSSGSESSTDERGRTVRSKGVGDPAEAISSALMAALVQRFGLKTLGKGKLQTQGTSAEDLSRQYQRADLVLDVRTSQWGIKPTSATRYAVFYEGSLRLVDTKRKAILAEGRCTVRPVKRPDDPSFDALIWDEAAILKQKLSGVIQSCVEEYRTRVLGLTMEETWKATGT